MLVEYALEGGATVLVDVNEHQPDVVSAGAEEVVARAAEKLEQALDATIRPIAIAVMSRFDNLPRRPDEVSVEFGVRLTAKTNAVVASAGGEGHFQVTLTWASKA